MTDYEIEILKQDTERVDLDGRLLLVEPEKVLYLIDTLAEMRDWVPYSDVEEVEKDLNEATVDEEVLREKFNSLQQDYRDLLEENKRLLALLEGTEEVA